MDTIILAAGRGERLNGLVAKYHKPLVLIDGQPLVRRATESALAVAGGDVVVVVAPQNAGVVAEVLEGLPAQLIVQRYPTGPGDGLLVGLKATRTDKVLVLLGDNVLTTEDVKQVVEAEPYGVGVQYILPGIDAERYTRRRGDGWVEKEPIDFNLDVTYTHVPDVPHVVIWVGPLTIDARAARESLPTMYHAFHQNGERPIGPYLDYLSPEAQLIPVSSIDIGTPEAVTISAQ
jgi:CTP:molybdopterin cytidylyltransferase MocA